MPQFSFRTVGLALTAGLSLAACDTYGYGGYGGGYGSYGYGSGISVGYASNPYWGWNDGYYYPGSGYYVYDSYRRPYRWNQQQQTYWVSRQSGWRAHNRYDGRRENWRDFRRRR